MSRQDRKTIADTVTSAQQAAAGRIKNGDTKQTRDLRGSEDANRRPPILLSAAQREEPSNNDQGPDRTTTGYPVVPIEQVRIYGIRSFKGGILLDGGTTVE